MEKRGRSPGRIAVVESTHRAFQLLMEKRGHSPDAVGYVIVRLR